MPKKKGKKKEKKEKPPPDPNLLTEVDKTFYELQITDLNRKLARLRLLTENLEEKNEELSKSLETLDQDRGDVITFLKRSLQDRSDEMKQLSEKLSTLQESKDTETEMYEQKISDLENEYSLMHETLTSEIKLLQGKLNSLEEFKLQKDDLMKKFEEQESAIEQQEIRHKREMYEIERKFIVGKDKLKKEMEARLLQLSTEFQDATEIRIAATTHRVIRENIIINNELDSMMEAQNTLNKDNARYKDRDRMLRQKTELLEAERKRALAKGRVQMGVIERLTNEHELMTKTLEHYKDIEQQERQCRRELIAAQQTIVNMQHQIKVLEQNVQSGQCELDSLRLNMNSTVTELHSYNAVINEAKMSIKSTLKYRSEDEAESIARKDTLLASLLQLLTDAKKTKLAGRDSFETVASIEETYAKGDLGFIPREAQRQRYPARKNRETQIGDSFHEMLKEYNLMKKSSTGSDDGFVRESIDLVSRLRSKQSSIAVPPPPSEATEESQQDQGQGEGEGDTLQTDSSVSEKTSELKSSEKDNQQLETQEAAKEPEKEPEGEEIDPHQDEAQSPETADEMLEPTDV